MKVNDVINPYGKITRISNYYVWFGKKRYSINTISKFPIRYAKSPNIKIDWTNEKEVDDYYKTFNKWSVPIRMGDIRKYEIFKIKNNKVYKNGEYYLPLKFENSIPSKVKYSDGYAYGFCITKKNAWYDNIDAEYVNIYMVNKLLSDKFIENRKLKMFIRNEFIDDITYIENINYNHLDSYDLQLIKQNFDKIFENELPYRYNNVFFGFGQFNRIVVSYDSKQGYLTVDNSYYGHQPYGEDYGLIIKINPYFTNEMKYYVQIDNILKLNKTMLNTIADNIIKKWSNYKY
jgi:hypothetical protein